MQNVAAGNFREDIFARLTLWTFSLPGLAERREVIVPDLEYELQRFAEREGTRVTFAEQVAAGCRDVEPALDGVFKDALRQAVGELVMSRLQSVCF